MKLRKYILAALCCSVTLVWHAPAKAEDGFTPEGTATALSDFEMTGTWAPDCSRPASKTNLYVTQSFQGLAAYLTFDTGVISYSNGILAKELTENKIVVYTRDFEPGIDGETVIVFVRMDDKIRVSDNRARVRKGDETIERVWIFKGMWVAQDGTPGESTKWLSRCK